MSKITKKVISFCLALFMVVTLLPTQSITALAENDKADSNIIEPVLKAADDELQELKVYIDSSSTDFDNSKYGFDTSKLISNTGFYKVGTAKIGKAELETNLGKGYKPVTEYITNNVLATFTPEGDTNKAAFESKDKTWKITEYRLKDEGSTNDGYHLDLKVEPISQEENTVPVAVYVTDGSNTFSTNYDLMETLKIGYVQSGDQYAPVGVIYLPTSFFEGKNSPYIKSDNDWQQVKDAIRIIDTSKLAGEGTRNSDNKIYELLTDGKVSIDYNGTAGTHKTALFSWNTEEATKSISLIDNEKYKYHLDLRLNTYCVKYLYVDTDGNFVYVDTDGSPVYKTVSFFATDVVTEDENNLPGMPAGYEVKDKYIIESDNTHKTDYAGTKLKDNETIRVLVSRSETPSTYNVTFDLNGGQIDSKKGDIAVNNVTAGKLLKAIVTDNKLSEPTRLGYRFLGWSTSKSGNAITGQRYDNYQINSNTTFYALWEKMSDCTVTYKYEGDVPSDKTAPKAQTAKYGETITLRDHPKVPAGYTFAASEGWVSGGRYTVTGDVTFVGTWTANEVPYTIEYYYEKSDDTGYSKDYIDDTKRAKTGTHLSVDNADISGQCKVGFVYDDAKTREENDEDLLVKGNGNTKLKIYYKRLTHYLTFAYKNSSVPADAPQLPAEKVYLYGQEIDRFDNIEMTAPAGYTFGGWYTGSLEYDRESTRYRMPNQDFTIYAILNANTDTPYKLTNYFEKLDGTYEPDTSDLAGTTGASVNVYDEDGNVVSQPGFTFDQSNTGNVLEGTIAANGSTELKVYYKRNTADITYVWVDKDGNTHTDTDSTNKWGSTLDKLKEVEVPKGYTFVGWTKDQAGTSSLDKDATLPMDGITLYGKLVANTDTVYKVEYYKQPLDMSTDLSKYELADTDKLTGTTDSVASFDKNSLAGKYTGFTLDEANSKLDAVISGDGTTVYKVYYTRNTYTVTVKYQDGSGNTLNAAAQVKIPFGGAAQIATPEVSGYTPNYRVVTVTDMPAKDYQVIVVYTANSNNNGGNTGNNNGNNGRGNNGGSSNNGSTGNTSSSANADMSAIVQPTATGATVPFTITTAQAADGRPVVVATPEVAVEDEAVPAGAITTDDNGDDVIQEISDDETPLALGTEKTSSAWALINLLSAIITVILAIILLFQAFKKKDEDEEAKKTEEEIEDEKKRKRVKLLGLIPAIAAVIAFILTENIFNPMAYVDKWTILMIILLVVELLICFFTRKKDQESKDEELHTA